MLSSNQEVLKGKDAELDWHVVVVSSTDLSTLTIVETYAITIKGVVCSSSRDAVDLNAEGWNESRVDNIIRI